MTRGERRALLVGAVVLAAVCSALFARAVLAQRASDLARAQARAAILPMPTSPASDAADRLMIGWSGGTAQMRYWQALQRFQVATTEALRATQYTLSPSLPLVFRFEQTVAYLKRIADEPDSPARRSQLQDMLGLAYFADAELHQGQEPIEPELDKKAIAAFRQAVLLDGSNDAAKTNLEVLLRLQPAPQKGGIPHQPTIPDAGRAEGQLQDAIGLPSQNGAVGRRVSGGY